MRGPGRRRPECGKPGANGGKSREGGEDRQNDPGNARRRAGQRRMAGNGAEVS